MYHQRFKTIEERFWEKVEKTDYCWNWTASTVRGGYGWFWYSTEVGYISSHLASWRIHHNGEKPEEWVLHTCDNKLCVNPQHLYLGDRIQNVSDAKERGGYKKAAAKTAALAAQDPNFWFKGKHSGDDHFLIKMTKEKAEQVRQLYAIREGVKRRYSQEKLAEMFGVSQSTISYALKRRAS